MVKNIRILALGLIGLIYLCISCRKKPIFDPTPTVILYSSSRANIIAINTLTSTPKWTFNTNGTLFNDAVISEGVLYAGTNEKKFYAIDIETGQKKWEYDAEEAISSSPTVVDGAVYFGSLARLYSLDARTGHLLWTFKPAPGGSIYSSPAVSHGIVYVGSYTNKLYAIRAASGEKVWEFTTSDWIYSSPSVASGLVYVGCNDKKLYAVDSQTGTKKWELITKDVVYSSPIVANGVVYVGGLDTNLYAIDALTGQPRWTYLMSGPIYSSPVISNNTVYVTDRGSSSSLLSAIDAQTGQPRWKVPIQSSYITTNLVVVKGLVYAGEAGGKLHAFDQTSGAQTWEYTLPFEGGKLLVFTANGQVTGNYSSISGFNQ